MAVEPLERALECAALQPAADYAADFLSCDEARVFEDAQMLDEPGERHPEGVGEIPYRVLALPQPGQHGAARRVSQGAKDGIETGG